MGGLHRPPHHAHQVISQGIQVCLVPKLGGEGFQGLSRVVLAPVEAAIDEGLDTTPQGIEQGRDRKGRNDYGELGLLLLAGEGAEESLQRGHPSEVHCDQCSRQSTIDEGAIYDDVDVVEAVPRDRDSREDRHPEQADADDRDAHVPAPDGDHATREDGAHDDRARRVLTMSETADATMEAEARMAPAIPTTSSIRLSTP